MLTRYIGDIHGKIAEYQKIIDAFPGPTVQVGDFGIGFVDAPVQKAKDRFIRGNHDSPYECTLHMNWIPDGTFEDNVLYVGGAWSIDSMYRTPGLDWWADEELSEQAFIDINAEATEHMPSVIVSHDCPLFVPREAFYKDPVRTRTQHYLEELWELTRPKLYIHGHWHQSFDGVIGGTRFICLRELGYIDIDPDEFK